MLWLRPVNLERCLARRRGMNVNDTRPSAVVVDAAPATGAAAKATSPLAWLPYLGLVIVAGIGGAALGVSGVLGSPSAVSAAPGSSTFVPRTVDARVCAGGPVATSLQFGTHVLAVQRSDDSEWAGVRNPAAVGSTVWVLADALVVDEGQPPLAELPVGGTCPVVVASAESAPTPPAGEPADEPSDEAEPAPNPGPAPPPPPPPPPSDTTPPSVQQLGVNVNGCPAVIQAVASDNVGVTQVTLSWSGVASGSGAMTLVGGSWRFEYDSANAPEGAMTFTAVARDAAGNASAAAVANVYMVCLS